jgi:23S rRNA (uracil1939-C5)-methyltransferase
VTSSSGKHSNQRSSKLSNKRQGTGRGTTKWRKVGSNRASSSQDPTPAVATVEIHDLAHDGRGVAYVEGRTVFVAGALPNETVVIKYTSQRGKFDQAVVTAVEQSSTYRIGPACPHFNICGGCQLQYLEPAQQIIYKQQQLIQALERLGKVTPRQILAPITAAPWHYRRRARLGVKFIASQNRVELGFRQAGSDKIATIDECAILMPPFNNMMPMLTELISSLSVAKRIPQIELLAGDKNNGINFHILVPTKEDDRQKLLAFGERYSLIIYTQSEGVDTVKALSESESGLFYRLPDYDLELEFLPSSFLQVNSVVNEKLISLTLGLLQLDGSQKVLDLFCGLGNFTLPLAKKCAQVVGVEGNERAVLMAEKNCLANNITNAEFYVTDLADSKRDRRWQNQKYDAVLLDPPRSGAANILSAVARTGAKRIVYVSCHPGSLARDVGILVNDYGYTLEVAGAVDMFPQTSHLESIVLLVK